MGVVRSARATFGAAWESLASGSFPHVIIAQRSPSTRWASGVVADGSRSGASSSDLFNESTELKWVKIGKDAVLNNEHAPERTKLEIRTSRPRTDVGVAAPPLPQETPWATRRAIDVWLAMSGEMTVRAFLSDGTKLFEAKHDGLGDDVRWLEMWRSFSDDLIVLEAHLSGGPFQIPEKPSGKDIAEAECAAMLLRGETVEAKRDISLPHFKRRFLPKLIRALETSDKDPTELMMVAPPRDEEMFGTKIAMCGLRFTFFIPQKHAVSKLRRLQKSKKMTGIEFGSVDTKIEPIPEEESRRLRSEEKLK